MAAKIALVTGANGFVGCHVVRALCSRVAIGCARSCAKGRTCGRSRVSIARSCAAIFAMPNRCEQATRGCDEVYHVAADYRLWVIDEAPCMPPTSKARATF